MFEIIKPIKRSYIRLRLGRLYYGMLRKILWVRMNERFASNYQQERLPFSYFLHKTILLRKLKNVDMWLQHNKIINLKIATQKLNGILIRPGEIFSYWKLIGRTSKNKGFVEGMVLKNGAFCAGVGGDLMIQNNTQDTYQLLVSVGDEYLEGEWRISSKPKYTFHVIEKNHEMKGEYWGGYSRHNELYQQKFDLKGSMIDERLLIKNSAIMMYSPFLEDTSNQTK